VVILPVKHTNIDLYENWQGWLDGWGFNGAFNTIQVISHLETGLGGKLEYLKYLTPNNT